MLAAPALLVALRLWPKTRSPIPVLYFLSSLCRPCCLQDPPEPVYSVVDEEEEGMYFTDPAQLLEVFSQLEGRNMFMIQTVQDAEQVLEVARGARSAVHDTLGAEVGALRRSVEDMEAAIATAEEKCLWLQVWLGFAWVPGTGCSQGV